MTLEALLAVSEAPHPPSLPLPPGSRARASTGSSAATGRSCSRWPGRPRTRVTGAARSDSPPRCEREARAGHRPRRRSAPCGPDRLRRRLFVRRALSGPHTREAALTLLGRTVRRIDALSVPAAARARDPRASHPALGRPPNRLRPPRLRPRGDPRALAQEPPPRRGALVLSHNDPNPTNFFYDGEGLLVLDWAAAGPMEAFFDLAVLAVFLRMDGATCLSLLSAYDGAPATALPDRFTYSRRLAAALAGTMQLFLARQMKHPGRHRRGDARLHALARRVLSADAGRRAEGRHRGRPVGFWARPAQGEPPLFQAQRPRSFASR